MFTSTQRMRPGDKPLADLHLKAYDQCKAVMRAVWAKLPPAVNAKVLSVAGQVDALNAELYTGKITFGEYNVKRAQILKPMALAFTGVDELQKPSAPTQKLAQSAAAEPNATQSPPASPQLDRANIPHQTRLALIIGNSKYLDLPKLTNPINDARAVADTLRDLGFETTLVTDASEQGIRRAVRKFADQSGQADLALVYYAGHGAQVNGENYLLPVDMEVPHTEADIELSSLKVDDVVNSLRSTTKIVFLDACRDNPALFKNLVKGRGAAATGLAPTDSSHLTRIKPGGGVFIAYATDAGSVAFEGDGEHSPFTKALLRNLKKPISIDDMFSLVTKEVSLVTKGTQRPYKYASLENIVCLAGTCAASSGPVASDIAQEVKRSEAEELQIALQTANVDALGSYLEKYPESAKRPSVLAEISRLKRSEFNEWTQYEINLTTGGLPQYFKISSIRQFGAKVAVQVRSMADPNLPIGTKKYPPGTYVEGTVVYDCRASTIAIADTKAVSPAGETLGSYTWGDPEVLDPTSATPITPGTVTETGKNIFCDEQLRTPFVTKKQLASMSFRHFASTPDGDREMYYTALPGAGLPQNEKEALVVIRLANEDKVVNVIRTSLKIV